MGRQRECESIRGRRRGNRVLGRSGGIPERVDAKEIQDEGGELQDALWAQFECLLGPYVTHPQD